VCTVSPTKFLTPNCYDIDWLYKRTARMVSRRFCVTDYTQFYLLSFD
jgi:hypothetical protein